MWKLQGTTFNFIKSQIVALRAGRYVTSAMLDFDPREVLIHDVPNGTDNGLSHADLASQGTPASVYMRPAAADALLEAIENGTPTSVRSYIEDMSPDDLKVAISSASKSTERCLRTPLMAATARGRVTSILVFIA